MTCREIKLLTDENVARSVVLWLREQGLDVLDVKEMGWFGASDHAILERAYQEGRFVLTHDADFGALAIHQQQPFYGILYLRLKSLRPEHVIRVCERLLQRDMAWEPRSIWVIDETRVRIRRMK